MRRRKISITVPDGACDAYLTHPDGEGPWPGVLFYQDGLGPRETLWGMADRLATLGYFVLLPNMYWRSGAYAPFDPKTLFAGPGPEMDRLMAILGTATDANVVRDSAAFFDFLGREAKVRGPRFGTTGYCFGGGAALLAACHFADRLACAASFHGSRFVVDDAAPALIREKVKCEVYLGVAAIDRRHTAETSARLDEALVNVPHRIEVYEGLGHGWCVPDLPPYDQAGAERHWERLGDLLKRNLG